MMGMTNAGKRRERATFERTGAGVDELGDPDGSWAVLGTRSVRMVPLRGAEGVAAQAMEASYDYRLEMRDSAFARSITEADRVVVQSVEYQIRSIRPTEKPGAIFMDVERGVAV